MGFMQYLLHKAIESLRVERPGMYRFYKRLEDRCELRCHCGQMPNRRPKICLESDLICSCFFRTLMSSSKPNGQTPNGQGKTNLEDDIAQLSALLSQEPSEGDDGDVAELLRQIEKADGMAQGVESKLDNVLQNLDNLLASLEPKVDVDGVAESSTAQGVNESQ